MPNANKPFTREQFTKWVHSALGRLYDAPYLQSHPLAKVLLGDESRHPLNRSQGLRRLLLDAIQSLRPEPGRPALSPDWRVYRILELRYIEGLTPAEVMDELKIGKSQFFRDQSRILDALVEILWSQVRDPSLPDDGQATEDHRAVETETGRLMDSATWETLDVAELMKELNPIIANLIASQGARFDFQAPKPLHVHADRIMLRQALLKVITHTLSITQDKFLRMTVYRHEQEMGVRLTTQAPSDLSAAPPQPSLEICAQLMTAMGGKLQVAQISSRWEATLAWPVSNPRVLLIIDDNAKIIELFRRYLAGQDWVVKWATSGAEANQRIQEIQPTVIMLDVMIPGEDGWEILMKLKKSPDTGDIPVIICSVVQEPQLARSLGAAVYLPKPVSQIALINALAPYSIPERRR